MKTFFLVIVSFIFSNSLYGQIRYSRTDPHDSTILADFNRALQAYGWPSLWDETKYVVQWKGVGSGGPEPYHVTSLTISAAMLGDFEAAGLPPCINLLKNIPTLKELGINVGISSLPPEIAELTNLSTLGLASNRLESIPNLAAMTNLEALILTNNNLTAIPDLSMLTKLNYLAVNSNRLLAELPVHVFTLTNLKTLSFENTSVTFIPDAIQNLDNLETLRAGGCNLSQIPEAIGALKNLTVLKLNNNAITSLPASMGNLHSLIDLDVSLNRLSEFPAAFAQLNSLRGLRFDSNNFTAFPESIAAIPSLYLISAEYNEMQGSIPNAVWNRPYPTRVQLFLRHNQLSGKFSIPDERVVHTLYISNNKYVLSDLYDSYEGLKANGAYMEFNPQAYIGSARTVYPQSGEDVSIEINHYTHLEGSTYTWYRRATPGGGQSEMSSGPILHLSDFNPATDGGVYFCKVTHPDMTGWELQSNAVRIIGIDMPAVIHVNEAILFRKGNTENIVAGASDDFTPPENLIWNIPATTTHFKLTDISVNAFVKSIAITPYDVSWTGTDTVSISVSDEKGNITSKSITITQLSEVNLPPEATIPVVYLKEESVTCDASEPCEPFFTWYADLSLGQFISDDFDPDARLNLTIDQEDLDRFEQNQFFVSVGTSGEDWTLSIIFFATRDTTLNDSFTLMMADTEGGVASAEVFFSIPINDNQPPFFDTIPEQLIVTGQDFPALDLKMYTHDDYTDLKDLEWYAYFSANLAVTVKDGVAVVVPKTPHAILTDTITYYVQERTNMNMQNSIRVAYRTLESVTANQPEATLPVVDVYPNPGNGTFYLACDCIEYLLDIAALNSVGNAVAVHRHDDSEGGARFQLGDVSDGMYFLQIRTRYGVYIQKIVVSR